MAFDEEKIERIMLNLIQVKDKGIGIPPDRQQDIFQRFYQISPVNTRQQEGSGQARIENIQLEFSDIYSMNKQELHERAE